MKSINNYKKKGQVSFEFLLVVGFGFTFLIPVLFFFLTYSNNVTDEIVEKQINDIGYALKKNIEIVELYGPGSLIELEVNVPEDLKNVSIINGLTSGDPDMIFFELDLVGVNTAIPIFVYANLTGGLNGSCIAHGKRLYYVLNNGSHTILGCKIDGDMQDEIDTVYEKIIYRPSYTCGDGAIEAPFEECDDSNVIDGDGCNHQCFNELAGGIRTHVDKVY